MNPPEQITTPPDGYEWTGEFTTPAWSAPEPYGEWDGEQWRVALGRGNEPSGTRKPILRKIKPPTVMVELAREDAKHMGETHVTCFAPESIECRLAAACRKALEQES